MAFDLSGLSAYIEDRDFPLIAQMQATGGLAEKVNVQAGLKGSSHLQLFNTSVTFQAGSCNPTYADTTTFSQRTITVGEVMAPEKICPKSLEGFWTQTMLKKGSAVDEIEGGVEAIWLEQKMNEIQYALAVGDFQGDTAGIGNTSFYDGLLKIIDADASVINGNTVGATAVTSANILTILDNMYLAIPENIKGSADLSLWIPQRWFDLYNIALKNANLFHYTPNEGESKLYGTSLTLRPTVGLTGLDRAVIARDSNITIGMDGEADADTLEVRIDPVSNKSILFNVTFKRGVQYAFGNEIVEFTLA